MPRRAVPLDIYTHSLEYQAMSYKINSYLNFPGTCAEAFTFYGQAFGAVPQMLRMGDVPGIPAEHRDRIMHACLSIGGDNLMGADCVEGFGSPLMQGNGQHVVVQPETREEADRLYAILSEGGKIECPLGDQFFGYFANFVDRFGICWMIVIIHPSPECQG